MKMLLVAGFAFAASLGVCYSQTVKNPISFHHVEGSVPGVAISRDDTHLYLAGERKFQVYDLAAEPQNPRLLAELGTGLGKWEARQLIVHRGYAYLTARARGLWVFDVREARRPRLVGSFDTAELATGIDAAGDILFVTLRVFGVQTFDISNPERPRHINLFRTQEAQSCYFENGLLAIGDWGGSQVLLADASNPAELRRMSISPLDGYGDGVFIMSNRLYAATGHHARQGTPEERKGAGHGLEIFDISNPRRPVRLGGVKFPRFYQLSCDFWTVRRAGKWLAVADTHNGFYLVDDSDAAHPRVAASLRLPTVTVGEKTLPDCVGNLAVGAGAVYLAGMNTGLYVAEVPESTVPRRADSSLRVTRPPRPIEVPGFRHFTWDDFMVRRVATDGETLYVAVSGAGLKRFRPGTKGCTELKDVSVAPAYDVAVQSNRLVTVDGEKTLRTFQIAADGSLRPLGVCRANDRMQILHLYAGGRWALTSCGSSHVSAFDLRDPAHPKAAATLDVGRLLYSDAFAERVLQNRLPVNTHTTGLKWLELGDSGFHPVHATSPSGTGKVHSFDQLDGVTVVKDRFIIPAGGGAYSLFSAADFGEQGLSRLCRADAPVGGIPTWDGGNRVIFAHRRSGEVAVFDAAAPERLHLLNRYSFTPGMPDRCLFFQGKLVVPAGFNGLYIQR